MNHYLIRVILVALQLVACAANVEQDWNGVFSVAAKKLEPAKTNEMLKKIDADNAKSNDLSEGRKNLLKHLIQASQISESKCTPKWMKHLNALRKTFILYDINILPFLDYYKGRQVTLCKMITDDEFEADGESTDSIGNLDQEMEQRRKEYPVTENVKWLLDRVFIPDAQTSIKHLIEHWIFADMLKEIKEARIGIYHAKEYAQQQEAVKLLDACQYTGSSMERYMNLDSLIDHYVTHRRTIQRWLFDCRQKQLKAWKKEFEGQIREEVANLRPEIKRAMGGLRDKVFAFGPIAQPYFDIPLDYVKEAYLWFAERKLPELIENADMLTSEEFKEQLTHSFKAGKLFCYSIRNANPNSEYVQLLKREPYLIKEVDQTALTWLGNFKICDKLLDNWQAVSDFTYMSLMSKKGMTKRYNYKYKI